MSDDRLDELDKVEWFDVARRQKPEMDWDEFSENWDEFQAEKSAEIRKKGLS